MDGVTSAHFAHEMQRLIQSYAVHAVEKEHSIRESVRTIYIRLRLVTIQAGFCRPIAALAETKTIIELRNEATKIPSSFHLILIIGARSRP